MDRRPFDHPPERLPPHNQIAPPPSSHASPFPTPTAQPPAITPFADPFQINRDPFFPGGSRRGSLGLGSRASQWPPSQGNTSQQPPPPTHHHHHHSPPQPPVSHTQGLPPPSVSGLAMAHPFDDPRRRSVGTAGSPPQYAGGPPPHLSFPARNMPPPSPTGSVPPSSSGHHAGNAMRGPPTTAPFGGPRDYTTHRPGMSISAMLGGGDDRRSIGSPHSSAAAPAAPRSMQPPSPGRARSSSMREGNDRGMKGFSPPHGGMFREPGRMASEPRRDGVFGSPGYRREPQHSFRAFQAPQQEHLHHMNGHGAPARPNSQPAETAGPRRHMEEMMRPDDNRGHLLRHYGEPLAPPPPLRNDMMQRHERPPFQSQNGVTSHPQERAIYNSPQMENRVQQQPQQQQGPPMRYQPGNFGAPMREEQASLFRPAFQPTSHPAPDQPRESIEGRAPDMRRQVSRQSPPPPAEFTGFERARNGFAERPMTLEEHQRMEMMHREQQYKEGEGSVHRAVLNLSPELNRRGRNSPLPQAVQGAQPRHVGPGGDNPGIKMEFGRMFSGLGSGVGSATPHASHPANGTHTPSRNSPARQPGEPIEGVRGAMGDLDDIRSSSKAGSRGGKKNGRRSREEMDADGRNTPDARGNKRAKAAHPHHHHHHHHAAHPTHHHHHRHELEAVSRAVSNPLSQANLAASQAHHHHHHHAHPVGHHHHHTPRVLPPRRMPSTTVLSKRVLDESATKPRKHLGSQLYTTEVSMAPAADTPIDAKIKFSSKMKPIPVFEGKDNSTFTVRVPRYYLAFSESRTDDNCSLEEICRRRQLWGTDIYSDDSDVVAAAVHSGWLKGDFGEWNQDIHDVCDNESEQGADEEPVMSLTERPKKPVKVPEGFDAHITILILPPLEKYTSTHQHHVWSREWEKTHDGMSYMILGIEFVDEGPASRFTERGAAARKNRIALEEANRREAAAGLLMFANGAGTVRVGA